MNKVLTRQDLKFLNIKRREAQEKHMKYKDEMEPIFFTPPRDKLNTALFKGGKGGSTKQTVSNTPWSGVQPYMLDVFKKGQTLANQQSPNAMQTQSYDMTKQLATVGDPMNQSANDLNNATLSGAFLSPDSNPYLKQNVNTALDAVQSRVNSQFSGNNYGSSANQETLTRNLADTAAQMYGQNYTNERNNQMQAMGLTPTLNQNRYLDANQLSQAGSAQAEAPWSNIKNYASILGLGSGSGNSTTTNTANSSPLSSMLGGGLIGASLFGQGGALAGMGGLSGATGGLLGAGAGLIASDARLKTNIERVGTHPLGIGVYDYDKFGKRERGVLAQEVEQVMPEAVVKHPSGYRMVNYGLLDG